MGETIETFGNPVLTELIDIGIALSATPNLKKLLEQITTQARHFTKSDAGSLYIREGDELRFTVSQNDNLEARLKSEGKDPASLFTSFTIPIDDSSIAGHVAKSKEVQLIDDAYELPEDVPYTINKSFDEQNDYLTRSILCVPMIDTENEVIGVLQLINHLNPSGKAVSYPEMMVPLVKALASQAAVAIKNAQLADKLKEVHYKTILRLSMASEYRDTETGNHVKRVSKYSQFVAEALGLDEEVAETIMIASPMHDVGKIGIPDAILLKPGRFTDEEREVMKKHAEIGGRIMSGSESQLIQMCEVIALTHHEKWDGTGYPKGLKGEDIPIAGRIVAIADVFDALVSKRVYKDAMPIESVLDILKKDSGTHFDPAVVDAFFKALADIMKVKDELAD